VLPDLFVGALLIGWTALVHGSFMVLGRIIFLGREVPLRRHYVGRALLVTAIVLWFFLAVVVEAWSWAIVYLWLDVFQELEPALYFSTVCFTTLGFGDIVLGVEWRLLGAFQAAAGMVIFGWTTAMVFEAVQRIYGSAWQSRHIDRLTH